MTAAIQPDIKRAHTYETRLATMYVERKGECEYCRKHIAHYVMATIWTPETGADMVVHTSCCRDLIADAMARRSERRKARRAGR